MHILLLLLISTPLFAEPLSESLAETLEFSEVTAWYLSEKGGSTLLLGDNQSFTFTNARPQSFFSNFPTQSYLYGHIYNKINGQPRTNHVFIRKDRVKVTYYLAGYALVVLKENATGGASEKLRLSRVIRPQNRFKRRF